METRENSAVLEAVAARARAAGVFGRVDVTAAGIVAQAQRPAAPAEYRVELEKGEFFVGVFTPDRWLSHSVEADLLNTGDDLAELLKDELDELGYQGPAPAIDHYRNDQKWFTFRSRTGVRPADAGAAERLGTILLGYEACFRHLGDMHQKGEDE